jgi:mannosyltransferase OCH1-like enzyme
MFPKIIWQTHELPYEQLPNFQKDIINTWICLNPDWEHRYVDAKERSAQVREYDKFLHNCYLLLGEVHQADIWRLVTIYKNGGIYADMDSICIKSIAEATEWNYKGEQIMCSSVGFQHSGVNNSNFGAIKNNAIVKLILDTYILKYKEYGMEKLPHLGFGDPENTIFSKIIQENKKTVYFNNEYFYHTQEFKNNFDINNLPINNFDARHIILAFMEREKSLKRENI